MTWSIQTGQDSLLDYVVLPISHQPSIWCAISQLCLGAAAKTQINHIYQLQACVAVQK